jgi:hypothetical protein
MKKFTHNIAAALLGIMALLLTARAVTIVRDTAVLRLQIAAKQQEAAKQQQALATPLQPWEMMTAKQVVDGLILHYNLPLEAEYTLTEIRVKPKKAESDNLFDKFAVLKDPRALLGFLSGVSTLPYRFDVRELCIGTDCPAGFTMIADLKPKNPPPQ